MNKKIKIIICTVTIILILIFVYGFYNKEKTVNGRKYVRQNIQLIGFSGTEKVVYETDRVIIEFDNKEMENYKEYFKKTYPPLYGELIKEIAAIKKNNNGIIKITSYNNKRILELGGNGGAGLEDKIALLLKKGVVNLYDKNNNQKIKEIEADIEPNSCEAEAFCIYTDSIFYLPEGSVFFEKHYFIYDL